MLLDFLNSLTTRGSVMIAREPETPLSDIALAMTPELEHALQALDREARLELSHNPPAMALPAAHWALVLLENACRFLAHREFEAQDIAAALSAHCPFALSPECVYSVDLLLSYLPDAARLARAANEADPLVEQFQQLAARWPLSSVGMGELKIQPCHLKPVLSHPSLLQLYVDRIIGRDDVTRLGTPEVANGARAALGAYPSLSPRISAALDQPSEQVR